MLEEPRGGAAIRAVLLAAAALGVRVLLGRFWIAQAALGLLALWALLETLKIHRLRLDLDRRTYLHLRGWRFAPARRTGSLEQGATVFLDRHEGAAGREASRLRSRVIRLEIGDGADAAFALGFPMGPRLAADKAADYARRLGVALVDRTAVSPG